MQEPVNLLAPSAGLMFWTFAVLLGVVLLFVGGPLYFLRRRARAKRASESSTARAAIGSVAALGAEVAQLRTDVAQLDLAQEFTAQLLTRPSAPLATDDRARDVAPSVQHPPNHSQPPGENAAR